MIDPFLTLAAGPLSYEQVTVFLLAFGVLLGTARLFGEIARRFGQPTVLGEILAGIVLGATVLGNPAILGEDGSTSSSTSGCSQLTSSTRPASRST